MSQRSHTHTQCETQVSVTTYLSQVSGRRHRGCRGRHDSVSHSEAPPRGRSSYLGEMLPHTPEEGGGMGGARVSEDPTSSFQTLNISLKVSTFERVN